MIIKEIELHNIRSHVDTRIELGEGTYLFEGDIGSGKTTVLMGIEFALFGNTKSQFYKMLVRKGASECYVRIKFEHGGEDYEIFRSLKVKGGSIQSNETYVLTPSGRIDMSPNEIRPFFLKLMGITVSPGAKKSLPIVTYAIYTPQETMKSILTGKPEERIEIIRKIFNLDEYRIARDNAHILISQIRSEVKALAVREEELKNLEEELVALQGHKAELNGSVSEVERNIQAIEKELKRAQEEFENIESLRKEHEKLKRQVEALNAEIRALKRTIEVRKSELQSMQQKRKRFMAIQDDVKRYEELRAEEEVLRKKIEEFNELTRELARLQVELKNADRDKNALEEVEHRINERETQLKEVESKLSGAEELEREHTAILQQREDIAGELKKVSYQINEKEREVKQYRSLSGTCPVCKRPLTEEHKKELVEKSLKELNTLRALRDELIDKKSAIERKKEALDTALEELKKVKMQRERIKSELDALNAQKIKFKERLVNIERIQKRMGEVEKKLIPLQKVKAEYAALREELKKLESVWREYNTLKGQIANIEALKGMIENMEKEREMKDEKIKKLIKNLEELNYSEEKYSAVRDRYGALRVEMGKLRESLKHLNNQILAIDEEISKKNKRIASLRDSIESAKKLEGLGNWLDARFIPSLEKIEEMRLSSINDEFRALFEKWFLELLGEGEYNATVREDFSPVIRYEDYDMLIDTLSGGERTSVALAYRLTLNTMVKRALGMQGNLLILDEPTDGFSKDQLYKLKDILEKMETEQIIIVSHERELRNLADTIYRVEKINGVSTVRIV